ncbi:MAG: acetyl-CoA carboxylase biotin carboxyl carrier protein subunit [Rhodospirillales bacterium]|nr:acetyl-CoA carboxylase biotin carboxyl carrier protein subunit [Rhodospirillales bacterium]
MAKIEVKAEVAGVVWKVVTQPGAKVEEDDAILILESMKMEIPVTAPVDGTIVEVYFSESEKVSEGETVAILEI